ncbi:tricarballylate utilization 4Fe-4S protein TcuB [Cognatishimia sp. WU-CL00825]|uniref:tricarballylate utilization 4Fe-4S protein TcuB n=1 Tax=Cognatishimia sp. WU-CL00825 TaxID=3127658 RepID=UPI003109C699
MQIEHLNEARRQVEICNACRYCEGFCAVFPAMHAERAFSDGDITQFANLCHNCRGCYYACQYTAPHEFDLNLPAALAEVRRESWENYVWPKALARRFQTNAALFCSILAICLTCLILFVKIMDAEGDGFYAHLSHNAMIALFIPAFLLPIFGLGIGLRRYWQDIGGARIKWVHIKHAFASALALKNLSGGHGDGCNFEEQDRFSHQRRYAHQAIMYGFLLCFAATSAGTVLHYLLDLPAPYSSLSLPKLLGVPGGIMLTLGCGWMILLKRRSDRALGDAKAWHAEFGFTALLGSVAFSGLLLWIWQDAKGAETVLALHLGLVLAFFLLLPFSKMAHGFFRLAALIFDAQRQFKAQADS